jgi:hypothetical protein
MRAMQSLLFLSIVGWFEAKASHMQHQNGIFAVPPGARKFGSLIKSTVAMKRR